MIMKDCLKWNPVYGWKEFRLQRGSNSRPALHSKSFRKFDETEEAGGLNNSLMCTHIL